MKKLISGLLSALLLCGALTACRPTDPPTEAPNTTETPPPAVTTAPPDKEPVFVYPEDRANPASDFTVTENETGVSVFYIGRSTDVIIPSFIDGKPVTEIAGYSSIITEECSITSLMMPDSITVIHDRAFEGEKDLKSVRLSENLRRIGTFAFADCDRLTEIRIPASVTDWGEGAFSNCPLVRLTLEEGLQRIGTRAFTGHELTSLSLPSTIKEIGDYALASGNKLRALTLNEGLETIGEGAFASCFYLTELTLPSTVKTVNESAFWQCNSLKKLIFLGDAPASFMTETMSEHLRNCTVWFSSDAKGFTYPVWCCYPTRMTDKPEVAPAVDSDLEYMEENGGIVILRYVGSEERITVPDTIDGKPVTAVADGAFRYLTWIKSVTLPDSVTRIGERAFALCRELTEIDLPSELVSIGKEAFHSCTKLKDLTLPKKLESIGAYAFGECYNLSEVTLPGTLTNWEYAFAQSSITKATLEEGIQGVDTGAFLDCYLLDSVIICPTLTSIGDYAFCNTALEEAKLPDSVESIGFKAFHCKLKQIDLGKGVKEIGDFAFSASLLEEIVLPESLTKINPSTFYLCKYLQRVEIPDSVTEIGENAFSLCPSLKEITLPPYVTKINELAFNACPSLERVIFLGNAPENYRTEETEKRIGYVSYTVYYNEASRGFTTPTWCGYPSEILPRDK